MPKWNPGWLALPALAVLLASAPLLVHTALPQSSDASYHLQFVRSLSASLQQGNGYPRWVADCNDGYGAPVFVFYPPLASVTAAGLGLLTHSPLEALRWSWVFWLAAAALSFYLSVRPLYGRPAAAAGACLYTLLPYHLFDLYDRGALAEFAGIAWLPPVLVLSAVGRLTRAGWLALVIALAGLLLSNPIMALLSAVAWTGWASASRARLREACPGLLSAAAVALSLSAFYWLPMLLETPGVQMDQHFSGDHYHWRRNLLFQNEAELGYHPDVCKPWATLAATTTLFLTLGGMALGTRLGRPWAALSLLSFAMQTPLSALFWEHLPWLAKAQFPWRFGALQMAGCCLLWSSLLKEHPGCRTGWLLAGLAAPALLGAGATALWARPYSLDQTVAESRTYRLRSVPEYTPAQPRGVSLGGDARCFGDGPVQAKVERWEEQRRLIRVRLDGPHRLWLRTFSYQGWQARVDQQPATLLPGPLLGVAVKPGEHLLDFTFEPTSGRRRAGWFSLVAAALWLGVLSLSRRRAA